MTDHSDALPTAFATVLRRHRRAAGITQEGLAGDVGLSPRYISLLETSRHQPTLGTMGDIARALGLPLSQLIAEAETEARTAGDRGPDTARES